MTSSDAAVARLRREVWSLKGCVLLAILAAAGTVTSTQPQILRVRGIIVEDEAGRERILIGAPVPAARNRVRTDTDRVKEVWAQRFPKEYMGWYSGYRHSTNGILVLDEEGFDRVAIGDPVPDPNIGKRIGPSTGLVINDDRGFERTGYGLIKVDGEYRIVLGFDTPRGAEGMVLALYDNGQRGLSVRDAKQLLYLGTAPAGGLPTGHQEPFHGLLLKEGDKIRRIDISPAK